MIPGFLERLAEGVAQAPPLQQVGIAFAGGLLTSANPCVLVAAPLVVGFAGGTEAGRRHPALLSGAFVLGLAGAFTLLGLAAALTGTLLGDVGWGWKAALGVVLLLVGLHLAGWVRWLPAPDPTRLRRFQGAGLLGAFALGGLTGTLSAPCATPALAAVLTLVALQRRILWGGALLFAYALGHGLLLFLAGTSSGWVQRFTRNRRSAALATAFSRGMGLLLLACAAWVLVLAWQAAVAG